jgi:outer membrane protein assembly factor BamD (BamD/ComL family)
LIVAALGRPAWGQPERTRTLTFDAAKGQWIEFPQPIPGTAEAELNDIQTVVRQGSYRAALSAIRRFEKRYGRGHALFPDLLIAKAEAQIGRGDHYKAHLTLQVFLATYRGTALTAEALRLEFVIAEAFLGGTKRKVWGMRLLSGEDTAMQILDEITGDDADTGLGELALKTKADYLFARGEHAPAQAEYSRLVREYPLGRYHPFAMLRTAEAALAGFGGVEYDEGALAEAAARYTDFRTRYPSLAREEDVDDVLRGIEEKKAAAELSIGSYYERTGHVRSALFYFESAARQWPESVAGKKAARRAQLLTLPGEASGPVSMVGPGFRER